ncbi:hypothetical protein SAMN05660866_03196 [Maribacter arcticus]|uniref:Uncharacterized protein n=2 Tax=Maribacter arcticus TaxID=561365 RepID=A0A1T5E0X9_9FLAO|nr:hypothetical protein SAMN05660866_03196 [Maribacter arcticus]
MLTENKFSKYLLYAIGEIALVMIGIILALQVNNQNEIRKLNNLYKTYEVNIISELKTDLLKLNEMDSLGKVRTVTIENYVDYFNTDKLDTNILKSKADSLRLNLNFFGTSTYTIQDLLSTGNLKLFPSHKRNALLKYKNFADKITVAEFKSLEQVDEVTLDFRKEIDLLFSFNYTQKEHTEVKNWEYNIDSPQMRMRNNSLSYYLKLYQRQERIYESIRKETIKLIEILENNNKG